MDLASLNIEVKSTGVAPAARALDSLIKVASSGDAVIRNIASSLNYLRTQDFTGFAKNVQSLNNALRGTTGGFKEFVTSASSLNKVSNSFTAIATATDKLSGNSSGLSAIADQLERIKNSLVEMKGSASVISRLGAGNTTVRSGSSGGSVSRPEDTTRLSQAQNRILSQLEREAFLVNHTKAEWLEYRAAQAGVASQAQSYVNTLKNTTQATNQLGMSQKQYNATMRGVPAQITDIIVSLQGGQKPLTVLLQQGGQLKDMFQGNVVGALKAVASTVLGMINPFTILLGVVAGVGYSFYTASSQMTAFSRAMATTNGYAGIAKTQFTDLTKAAAGTAYSFSDAAEAMNLLLKSGKVVGQNIDGLTRGVLDFSKATGMKIGEAAQKFIDLADKPASKLAELNKQYHFLTVSVYKQVAALEDQGRTQEATALAQEELRKAAKAMNTELANNLGWFEQMGKSLGDTWRQAAEWFWSIGRDKSTKEKILDLNAQVTATERLIVANKKALEGNVPNRGAYQAETIVLQTKLDLLKKQRDEMVGVGLEGDRMAQRAAAEIAQRRSDEEAAVAAAAKTREQKKKDEEAAKARAKSEAEALQGRLAKLTEEASTIKDGVEQLRIREMLAKGLLSKSDLMTEAQKRLAEEERKLTNLQTKGANSQEIAKQHTVVIEQQRLVNQEKLTLSAEQEKKHNDTQLEIAEKLRATYGSQLSVIEGKLAKTEAEIQKAEKLGAVERKNMLNMARLEADKDKANLRGGLTGNMSDTITAEYNLKLAQIQSLRLSETEYKLAMQKLDDETAQKRIANFQQQLSQQGLLSKMMVDGINAVTGAMSTQIAGMLKGTVTANQAMAALGDTILNSVVNNIVKWGTEKLWTMAVDAAAAKASVANTALQTSAAMTSLGILVPLNMVAAKLLATAWAPAAAAASIATMGGAAAVGGTAAVSSTASAVSSIGSMVSSMMDNGGYVPLSGSAVIGEYGPELVQQTGSGLKVTSRQDTAKMLGGGTTVNVNVVNNAGVSVEQSADQEGNILIVLEKALPGMIASQAGNPKSSMNKALGSVFQMQRS